MKLALAIALLVLAPLAARAAPAPLSAAACVAKGGVLQKVCMSQVQACLVPFRTAGRPCTDGSQCVGRCLWQGAGSPTGPVVGRCETNRGPCGCFTTVAKGKVAGSICVD